MVDKKVVLHIKLELSGEDKKLFEEGKTTLQFVDKKIISNTAYATDAVLRYSRELINIGAKKNG